MLSLRPANRSGQSADLAAVTALLKSAGLPTDDMATASDLHLWVLEIKGDVIGAIGIERFGASALLRSPVIAPAYRRRGFGNRLVAHHEQDVQKQGVGQLILSTETADFRFLCPASAVCMAKALNQRIRRRKSDVRASV